MLQESAKGNAYEAGAADIRECSSLCPLPRVVRDAAGRLPGFRIRALQRERTVGAFRVLLDAAAVYVELRGRKQLRIPAQFWRLDARFSKGGQRLPDCVAAADAHQLTIAVECGGFRQRPSLRLPVDLRGASEHVDIHG